MNATRAATIRLRSAFDGAVSLGRVQTPTLALVVRREVEIRAFVPEPYWLVEARFGAEKGDYAGRYMGGKRLKEAAEADRRSSSRDARQAGHDHQAREEGGARAAEPPLRPDDAAAPREHAVRVLGAAHAAARRRRSTSATRRSPTRARTRKFLSGDLVPEIKPTAEFVGHNEPYRKGAEYVQALESLPLQRVVNDASVTDHHAIIPTRSEHVLDKMGEDERKIYDLVAKRFLGDLPSRRRLRAHARRDDRRGAHLPHQRPHPRRGRLARRLRRGDPVARRQADDDTGRRPDAAARSTDGEPVKTLKVESLRKETQPPRRYTEASLLGAMETAGKDIDRRRDARGDEGVRHRHAGHARVDHRAADRGRLHRARGPRAARHREGRAGHRAARRPPADVGRAHRRTGSSGSSKIEHGEDTPARVHEGHRRVHRRRSSSGSTST